MRLIDADALLINLDGMMEVSPTGYIHGETVADMISDAPTVDAVPVDWIEVDIEQSAFSGYDMHAYEVATMLEEWKEKERKEE